MKVRTSYASTSFVFAIKVAVLIFAFLTTLSCQEDTDIGKSEELAGQWIVNEVVYDGTLQSGWEGVSLTFEYNMLRRGLYEMPDSPYDSVWTKKGTWMISDNPSVMILNDSLETNFDVNKEELIITMMLPWTAQSTCSNGVCLPIVSGEWMFRFRRG